MGGRVVEADVPVPACARLLINTIAPTRGATLQPTTRAGSLREKLRDSVSDRGKAAAELQVKK